ncbi:serine hydrolase domain-containing protein [Bacillus suaedae]|uniref:Beta-lactamase family protein n=1 Tax=Halalkalibacter suaedae TaxID=2822140 RepID=A0A940WSY1_9BACI|nr:serine hydrolase domain-containing protein [Bacillus suaedae]MBP3951706.1 beta-lactamase family protein [Bacillus suaedae]
MNLNYKPNNTFTLVLEHINNTFNQVACSGSALVIIHNDSIVLEEYIGKQSKEPDARTVQQDTQFHVASVRKSYIGFAVAFAVHNRYIQSIDDLVLNYLPELDGAIWKGTTIRHLLTHTHGLNGKGDGTYREYPVGQNWTYRQVGVEALTKIVKRVTEKTISEIIHEQVFTPLGFHQSDWYAQKNNKLVDLIHREEEVHALETSESVDGTKMNMYVSARELAFWGYFHLKQGNLNGKQIVPIEIIQLATSLQSPHTLAGDLPRNGFLWFVQGIPAKKSEIGQTVPLGSYQILGYTTVTLLVIPQENIVAVRMFNSVGSPEGYDYLADVRSFGDRVMECV